MTSPTPADRLLAAAERGAAKNKPRPGDQRLTRRGLGPSDPRSTIEDTPTTHQDH